MPIYQIPEEAGPFIVVQGRDGGFAVAEARAVLTEMAPAQAAKLGLVFIPCRDEQQAEAVAERLNAGEHDGQIQVDLIDLGGASDEA